MVTKPKPKSKSKPKPKPKSKSKSTHKKGGKTVRKKVNSNNKETWNKFLKRKDSREALSKSWNSKNPIKYYKNTIGKLAKKYSNKK